MKRIQLKLALLLITGLTATLLSAQLPSSVIFSVKGNQVPVEEFERQFLKSIPRANDTITARDLDEYLRMYIDFKLKYQDAKDAGLDTLESYIAELEGYRNDLARNFLYDKEVTEALINEAYERMKYDVRASHILIYLKEGSTPADTLAAWKKMQDIAEQLKKDPGKFEALAKSYSDDPGTKENGGDLGFFTAFQLVYPFENSAYETPVGGISKVFRTQFGYHILKVTDKRPNMGEIKARHILLRVGHKPEATEEVVKARIDEIYRKIKNGETNFETMARQYSEDYNSGPRGGELDYISATQKVGDPEFQIWAAQAFSLKSNGEMTQPFRTAKGFYIVQRMDMKPLGSLTQLRLVIKNQVQNDSRSQKSVNALIGKVKTENNFSEYPNGLKTFIGLLDTNFHNGKFSHTSLPAETRMAGVKKGSPEDKPVKVDEIRLFSLGGEFHSVKEFAEYIETVLHAAPESNDQMVNTIYKEWVNGQCVNYQDRHLEEKNPEFKYLYQEYREGIVMFNRMQEKVWEKANTDSAGLAQYYAQHKNEYMWKDRFDCQVYFCATKEIMDKTAKQLKKNLSPDSIKKFHNASKPLNLDYRSGKYEVTDSFLFPSRQVLESLFADPKYRKANKIYTMGKVGNDWVTVKVNSFLPSAPKLLEETAGPVKAKYNDYLEKKWVEDLRARYVVVINDQAMAELKKRLVNH